MKTMQKIISVFILNTLCLIAYSQFTVVPTGTTSRIVDLALHGDTIIISGANYFAKTYDMGHTVVSFNVPGPSGYVNREFQIIYDDYYILSLEGMPFDHNYIMKSESYGNSWKQVYDTSGRYTNLSMVDSTSGIMSGSQGSIVRNLGDSNPWVPDTLFGGWSVWPTASQHFSDSTVILLTVNGYSFFTKDRGVTWDWGYCMPSVLYKDIQYINKDTIYAVGHDSETNPDVVFSYSEDGGSNFSSVQVENTDSSSHVYTSTARDLYFENPKKGYIVGRALGKGSIFRSNDYGQTWTPHLTGFSEELYCLLNVNDSISFIGGENGLLLKWNMNKPLSDVLSNNELSKLNQIQIYPNPFTEKTTFRIPNNQFPTVFHLYNARGQMVRSERIRSPEFTFYRKELEAGVYYYKILNATGKIIINP